MGKKGGHGRAGGKRNEPRGGGGNAAAKRSLPELRESVGKRQDVGLPQLGKYSKKMEKVLQNQHKRQFDSERPGKKRKVQEGDDGADAPMETGDMKSQLALLMLAANSSKNEYEAKQEFVEENALEIAAASNRSRENSKRRFWKEFQKVVKVSDVLLEVLDARDPLGCRLSDVEKTIDSQYAGKKHFVLVLNKVDLVPKENVIKWLDYFRVEGIPIVAFSAAGGGKAAAQETSSSKDHTDPHHRCVHHLFDVLKKFQRTEAGGRRHITVGIIGFPNVGKSSVINALKRERVVGVGNTPGFTTTAQEVTLQGHVKVVDCPGVVMSESTDAETVLRNALKIEQIADPVRPVELIVERCGLERLQLIYSLPACRDFDDFVGQIARKKGKLLRGAQPNVDEACKAVLKDWNDGRIHFYTSPPGDRDFITDDARQTLTEAEAAGESKILGALTSTANDFVCLVGKKAAVEATYLVDEDAVSKKRKRPVDADCSSVHEGFSAPSAAPAAAGASNPFKMFHDESDLLAKHDATGGMLEEDTDSNADAAADGGGSEETSDDDEDKAARPETRLRTLRKNKALKKTGARRRMGKVLKKKKPAQ